MKHPWLHDIRAFALFFLLGLAPLLTPWTSALFSEDAGRAFAVSPDAVLTIEAQQKSQRWGILVQYLQTNTHAAHALHAHIYAITHTLEMATLPYDEELHRLWVLSDSYDKTPHVLEALTRYIRNINEALNDKMEPALDARTEAQALLERVVQLEKSILALTGQASAVPAPVDLTETIATVKTQLTQSLARLDNALELPLALAEKARKTSDTIASSLDELWQQQYLIPPLRYTYMELWGDMNLKLKEMTYNFILRMDMEIPQDTRAWITVGVRFATVLFLGGLLTYFVYRRLAQKTTSQTSIPASIFYTCVPWLLTGVAVGVASLTSGQVYQTLLALGNVLLIIGQIALAWALRRTQCQGCPVLSPFWALCATTLVGYVLLYPGLPLALLALIWGIVLILALCWQYRQTVNIPLQMEKKIMQVNAAMLWISLFLLTIGLPQHSILLYILFTSVVAALQLSMGGMHALHIAAERLPKDGISALLGSIWLACVAPIMLILVVLGVTLWGVTLPGGYYLFHKYALAGFSIGDNSFNVLQLLLILSAFYITRTAVHIGSGLLTRVHAHGINIDASLIPPLQTAFTYGVWTLFGLFSLMFLGMELSNLAVVAGGLSVGIGFGMQAIVNNFLSGMILIFSRILQEGDVVDVGGLTGTVRKISVRATTVETQDNAVIYVPNAEFVSTRLINWTRNSRSVRREVTVGVAYGTDTDMVMRLLRDAAHANPGVLKYPAPVVLFCNFGNSTLDFSLRFWVHDFDTAVPTSSALRQDIEKLFRQHKVEVAFPQLDVHIKDIPQRLKGVPPSQTTRRTGAPRVLRARPRRLGQPQSPSGE